MPANPIRSPGEWQIFRIAGVLLPGIAKVTGCIDKRKLDVKKAKGTKGATVSEEGNDPKAFELELHLCTEEEIDEWDSGEGRRILKEHPKGSTSKAPGVDHPACQECDITAVMTESIGQKEAVGDGSYKVKIMLFPWSPPEASSGTPGGSVTKAPGGAAPSSAQTRADKLQEELGAALEEAAA